MTTVAKKAPVRKKAPAKAAASATPAKDVKAAPAKPEAEKAPVTPAKSETPKATAKAGKGAAEASAAAAALFSMPAFDMPSSLPPQDMVDLAEKSIANARDFYEQAKSSLEEQSSAFEKSMGLVTESSKDLQGKMVDAAKTNMEAGFSLLTGMIAAKSFSEALELQTSFAAKQFETFSAQSKDLQESVSKSLEDAAAPMKAAADKAFDSLKMTG